MFLLAGLATNSAFAGVEGGADKIQDIHFAFTDTNLDSNGLAELADSTRLNCPIAKIKGTPNPLIKGTSGKCSHSRATLKAALSELDTAIRKAGPTVGAPAAALGNQVPTEAIRLYDGPATDNPMIQAADKSISSLAAEQREAAAKGQIKLYNDQMNMELCAQIATPESSRLMAVRSHFAREAEADAREDPECATFRSEGARCLEIVSQDWSKLAAACQERSTEDTGVSKGLASAQAVMPSMGLIGGVAGVGGAVAAIVGVATKNPILTGAGAGLAATGVGLAVINSGANNSTTQDQIAEFRAQGEADRERYRQENAALDQRAEQAIKEADAKPVEMPSGNMSEEFCKRMKTGPNPLGIRDCP